MKNGQIGELILGSLQKFEHVVVDFSIGADEVAVVDAAGAGHCGGAAAGFFDDDLERRKVPGLGGEVDGDFDGAFGDEHVLPEAAEGAAVFAAAHESNQFGAHFRILAGADARGEDHGVAQVRDLGDVEALAIAVGAFAAVGPPASAESGSADEAGDDFAIALDAHVRAERGDAAGEFFCAVDGVDDHAGAAGCWRRGGAIAAHLFTEDVEDDAAGGNFGTGHGFDFAVGLRYGGAVFFAFDAHGVTAKVFQGDGVCFVRDLFQQLAVLVLIAHPNSLLASVGLDPSLEAASFDTLSWHT